MHQHSCLICGEPIIYTNKAVEMECINCHKKFLSHTKCVNEHFVCDQCHGSEALLVIKYECNKADSKNPIEIAMHLMKSPTIHMHGPEHHTLVGAALLTAYYNSGGKIDLNNYLEEMARRGGQVPGGICGLWAHVEPLSAVGFLQALLPNQPHLAQIHGDYAI